MSPDTVINEMKRRLPKATMRHKLVAVLVASGRIISYGVNEKRYSNKISEKHKRRIDTICAEKNAVLHAPYVPKRAVLYVARINKKGEFCMAEPCDSCKDFLNKKGISSVVFTNSCGNFQKLCLQKSS